MTDLQTFRTVYDRHVAGVVAGDLPAVLADMAAGVVPAVFEGVEVPRGALAGGEVLSAGVDADGAVGEARYTTADGVIGLRSFWRVEDGAWKAYRLENLESV